MQLLTVEGLKDYSKTRGTDSIDHKMMSTCAIGCYMQSCGLPLRLAGCGIGSTVEDSLHATQNADAFEHELVDFKLDDYDNLYDMLNECQPDTYDELAYIIEETDHE